MTDTPTYAGLIAAAEEMIRELTFQIANADGDTADLWRVLRDQEEQLKRLVLMRAHHSPDPKNPLP